MSYRESCEPSVGESSEEGGEEDPFNDEQEKESQLKYIEDIHIPTRKQEAEDEHSARIVLTLSLGTEQPKLESIATPFNTACHPTGHFHHSVYST